MIAEVAIEPVGGSIVPHERTLPGPFRDRLSLLRATRASLSPVHAVSRGPSAELSAYLDDVTSTEPEREVRDAEDTRHRLWVRPDGGEVLAEAVRDEVLMIADGHHRYAVALAFKQEMDRAAGAGAWDWQMMLVVDAAAEQPPVLPIHRLVRDPVVPGPATDVVTGLTDLVATIRDDDRTYGLIRRRGRTLEHHVGALRGRPPTVRALHEEVLGDSAAPGMRFVPDAVAAESSVRTGAAGAAYVLPSTRVERIQAVIAEGGTLPVKSTYF